MTEVAMDAGFCSRPKILRMRTSDRPAGFFQIEHQADESGNGGLPDQRAEAGINISDHHNQNSASTSDGKKIFRMMINYKNQPAVCQFQTELCL